MNTIIFLLNAHLPTCFLSATATSGFFLTVFFFLFCFLLVHIFVLLKLGWNTQEQAKKATQEPEKENKPPAPKKADKEPIYYIVERKRTRPRQNYGEPKEFRFK